MTKIFLREIKGYAILFLVFSVMIILSFGKGYSYAVKDGLSLWAGTVIPALFPYIFLTAILSSVPQTQTLSEKFSPLFYGVFNVSGLCGYAYILSVISGYPIGTKIISDLYLSGRIDTKESVKASTFCANPSPAFTVSCIGAITFNDKLFGIKLYLICLLSSLIVGISVSGKRKGKPQRKADFQSYYSDTFNAIGSSVNSILSIGGIITLFYLFTEVAFSLNLFYPLTRVLSSFIKDGNTVSGITFGIFEVTRGIKCIALSKVGVFTLPICASMLSFGGLSVIMQCVSYLKKAKIKTAPFILARILSAVISFIIALILSLI